jgi:hypothetical protein
MKTKLFGGYATATTCRERCIGVLARVPAAGYE